MKGNNVALAWTVFRRCVMPTQDPNSTRPRRFDRTTENTHTHNTASYDLLISPRTHLAMAMAMAMSVINNGAESACAFAFGLCRCHLMPPFLPLSLAGTPHPCLVHARRILSSSATNTLASILPKHLQFCSLSFHAQTSLAHP